MMSDVEFVSEEENRVYVQWKGTDVCLDFFCDCGVQTHLDAYNAYAVKCPACGDVYELRAVAKKVKESQWEPVVLDDSDD